VRRPIRRFRQAFRRAGYKVYSVTAQMPSGADVSQLERTARRVDEESGIAIPHPVRRAMTLCAWWAMALLTLPAPIAAAALYLRVRRANFGRGVTLLATTVGRRPFGYLTLRSVRAHARGEVSWKDGRIRSGHRRTLLVCPGLAPKQRWSPTAEIGSVLLATDLWST